MTPEAASTEVVQHIWVSSTVEGPSCHQSPVAQPFVVALEEEAPIRLQPHSLWAQEARKQLQRQNEVEVAASRYRRIAIAAAAAPEPAEHSRPAPAVARTAVLAPDLVLAPAPP